MKAPGYLEWIRTLPCCNCQAMAPSQAHHLKGIGMASGAALRADDLLAMPLCSECHDKAHNGKINLADQARWGFAVLVTAIHHGFITYAYPPDELPDLWG